MTLSTWRNLVHKFIVMSGLTALMAVASGSTLKSNTGFSSLAAELTNPRNKQITPLSTQKCESEKWLKTPPNLEEFHNCNKGDEK